MKTVKIIFQVLAGLWLLGMLSLGFGSAWVTHNPDVVADLAADSVVELSDLETAGDRAISRKRVDAQERAFDNGWGSGQALPENATLEAGGWAD